MSNETRTQFVPPRNDVSGTRAPENQTQNVAGATGQDTRGATLAMQPPGYTLGAVVGEGGMGVVYRARELAFDRDVAVKVLHGRYSGDGPAARRFLAEARITGQLQHPAIPPVHHLGSLPDGRPFLAMKLIGGDTLAHLLKSEPANRGRFVRVFAQVCQGVAYAHARGVIHRDLKPANVMVGAFGEVQVMDWGLAKEVRDHEATRADDPGAGAAPADPTEDRTQDGSILGTPAYMAPEQAAGEVGKVDARSDVFGLGAVLCTILTGKPPYHGPTPVFVCAQAVRGATGDAFARLDACGADRELVALCKRCLASDPDARPRDAGEVAKAVTAHLAAAEERARRAELARVRAAEERKRRRVRAALVAAVVVLVVTAGLGALLAEMWWRADAEKRVADGLRVEAEGEKQKADALRNEADAERQKARLYLYQSRVGLASRAWNDGQVHREGELLEQERRPPTGQDFRGFEWHYLWRILQDPRHVLRGHTEAVRSVAWRPDGKRLATGSRDGTVRIWDADTAGPTLLTLDAHKGDVHGACWSPDGKQLASAATDGLVKIWDAEKGQLIRTLTGHRSLVVSLTWSRDGARLASGSWDNTVLIWDTQNWSHVTCSGHTAGVDGVAFSPDGERLASAGADCTVKVWDAGSGRHLLTCTGHTDQARCVCWSPDGKRIASAAFDRTIRLWSADEGKPLAILRGHTHGVTRVCFDPEGKRLASASQDGTVRLWDGDTGGALGTLRGHTGQVACVEFSPDGRRLASASFDKTARLWDALVDQESVVCRGHKSGVWAVAFSPDGASVASGGFDGTVRVWDPRTGKERLPPLMHTAGVYGLAYSPDGKRLATGALDGTVRIWKADTGELEHTLPTQQQNVWNLLAFTRDGTHLVTATGTIWYYPPPYRLRPPEIKVWQVGNWREVATLKGHTALITGLVFSPDGKRLATSSYDQTVRVWDTAGWREIRALKWSESWPLAIAYHPDGRQIAAGSQDGTLLIWDAETGREVKKFSAHTEDVLGIAYSPDGSRLASCSHDHTVKLWEPVLGSDVLTLKAHTSVVYQVTFSPDGKRLASTSNDATVRVWDATPLPETGARTR